MMFASSTRRWSACTTPECRSLSNFYGPTWVAGIIYFPLETELLRAVRGRGCRTMAGIGAAVFQADEALRLFTGLEPDAERMKKRFESM
jgi:quinate/shikimate dehydrogenase (NAD+)